VTTKGDEADFERLLRDAEQLPLKRRLRLLDALRSGAVIEREDGLRFAIESLPEYKRASRSKAANKPLEKWIASFGPADVFFDIGANTGSLSLLAARAHEGRVPIYAFEPAFDSFGALVRNVLVNDLGRVITPLQIALFDETGIRPLHRSTLGAGSALHAVGEALDYARRPFTPAAVEHVLTFRLDDLVRAIALPVPTRVKLDVDGAERKVLAGAIDVLSSARCDVYTELVEVKPEDPHPTEVISFLCGLGYELAEMVEHCPPNTYPRIVDALFVSQSRAADGSAARVPS
jgi:FkbM family methyltransferase